MSRTTRNGISRVEVVVLVVLALIMIGMLLPTVQKVRGPSYSAECAFHLRQLMLALQNFHDAGRQPAALLAGQRTRAEEKLFPTGCLWRAANPEERLSWMVAILPYLEHVTLYEQFEIKKGYSDNAAPASTRTSTFICPAPMDEDRTAAITHYIAMSGIGRDAAVHPAGAPGNGFMGYDRLTSLKMIEDGASYTIALMETRVNLGPWARGGMSTVRGIEPADTPLFGDQRQFGLHPSGSIAAMADASVRVISPSIGPKKLAAAITIADKDEPGTDW